MTKLELINRINQVQAIRGAMTYQMPMFDEIHKATYKMIDLILEDARTLENYNEMLSICSEVQSIFDVKIQ